MRFDQTFHTRAAHWNITPRSCWPRARVRVRVRLIDLRNTAHFWAATYERRLADIFIVQSEITRAIADHLQTSVSVEERNAINDPRRRTARHTTSPPRAREISDPPFNSTTELFANLAKTIPLLDEAVAGDPNFVLAYCALADAHDAHYSYRIYAPRNSAW